MNRFFRRILEPAKTSPSDPFRWGDTRSTDEQVANGFLIAGGIIAGFAVLFLAFGGIQSLAPGSAKFGTHGTGVAWSMLGAAAILMVWTAHRWVRFLAAFLAPAAFKLIWVVIFGPSSLSFRASNQIPRALAVEGLLYLLVVIALIWRFVRERPAPTTFVDRIALTFFVLITFEQITIPYHFPPVPLIAGALALLIAWCIYRWQPAQPRSNAADDSDMA